MRSREKRTYSISVRLRRTKSGIWLRISSGSEQCDGAHPDQLGRQRVNPDKVFELAKLMGSDASTLWAQEHDPLIEIHPRQSPPPRA